MSMSMSARRRRGAALALAAAAPLALLIITGTRAGQPDVRGDPVLAACTRVYDADACACALRAVVAATPAPGRDAFLLVGSISTGELRRAPIFRGRDFVHIVQACMAPDAHTPAD
jgi:hypothetical protein